MNTSCFLHGYFGAHMDIPEQTANQPAQNDEVIQESDSFIKLATYLINKKHEEKEKRNIWENSPFENISKLENDDVGNVGEQILNEICSKSQIDAYINGTTTKQSGGGIGDGKIKGYTAEVKTARQGSSSDSFQHELGEMPWLATFMIFIDITPDKIFVTIFKNYPEEFYKSSGRQSSIKCHPYFPTKSITWRKQLGAFKLDTTVKINEVCPNTFTIDEHTTDYSKFKTFVDNIIP